MRFTPWPMVEFGNPKRRDFHRCVMSKGSTHEWSESLGSLVELCKITVMASSRYLFMCTFGGEREPLAKGLSESFPPLFCRRSCETAFHTRPAQTRRSCSTVVSRAALGTVLNRLGSLVALLQGAGFRRILHRLSHGQQLFQRWWQQGRNQRKRSLQRWSRAWGVDVL